MASSSRAEDWKNEINLSMNNTEYFQQYFSNPLLYDQLNLTSRSHPDSVFDKMPNWNDQAALTQVDDGQVQFLIDWPHPVLLNTIHFSISVIIDNMPPVADINKVMPIADFFSALYNCVSVNVGQNTCNIDHLDTHSDIWSYVFKRLFSDNDYQNHLGRIDGMIPDSPGSYQFDDDGNIPEDNLGGRSRNISLFRFRNQNRYCLKGIFKPANLFFEKNKILPPYVPLRFTLKRNDINTFIKCSDAAIQPTITVQTFIIRFMNYNMRSGVYENFRELYEKSKNRLPEMEMPINPFTDPSAIYEYFDIRASQYTIQAGVDYFIQPLRTNSNIPKAIIFCLSQYRKTDRTKNHLEFIAGGVKSYSIMRDAQPIVPCSVKRHTNCSNPNQDFYLRTRNFLHHLLTNETNSLRYLDYSGGCAIFAESLNFANDLWVPSRQTVGGLELKLEFENVLATNVDLYVFLVFDQKLIINELFNAFLVTSV